MRENHTMEFPPEIAHYANPSFLHWKLYEKVKEWVDVRHWSSIRNALQGPNEVQVSVAAQEYLKAVDRRKFCEYNLRTFDLSVGINQHLQSWCHERQMVVQLGEFQEMVPLPVLTDEQEATKRRCESSLIQAKIQEVGELDELMFVVYGREWDSD